MSEIIIDFIWIFIPFIPFALLTNTSQQLEIETGQSLVSILVVVVLDKISSCIRREEGVVSAFCRWRASVGIFTAVAFSVHWGSAELSVKLLGWESANLNMRPWFSNDRILPLGPDWGAAASREVQVSGNPVYDWWKNAVGNELMDQGLQQWWCCSVLVWWRKEFSWKAKPSIY